MSISYNFVESVLSIFVRLVGLLTMVREMLNAEERAKCWKSRDLYFNCMEENVKSEKRDTICAKFSDEFSANCPPVWVRRLLL